MIGGDTDSPRESQAWRTQRGRFCPMDWAAESRKVSSGLLAVHLPSWVLRRPASLY